MMHANAVAPLQEVSKEKSPLQHGAEALAHMQRSDGGWEGECVWCPMLAAQYVLASHLMEREIDDLRKQRLLLHFQQTRLPSGVWGLHPQSDDYLFTTALVYVAARFLGAPADAPWLQRARRFIEREGGVGAIPTWGKLWLCLLNLYDWEGLNPVPPKVWLVPQWVPFLSLIHI